MSKNGYHYRPTGLDVATVPRSTKALLFMMIKPFQARTGIFFLLTFFGVLAWTCGPFVISQIVNELSKSVTITNTIWILAGIYAALVMLDEMLWRIAEYLMSFVKPPMLERIRTILFAATLKRSHSYFVNASSGRIGHWINQTVTTMTEVIDTTIWTAWPRVISMLIAAGFLFHAHWMLGTLFVVWLVLLFTYNVYRGKPFSKKIAEQSDATSIAAGMVVDSVSNHLSVRVFNARHREYEGLIKQQSKIIYHWRDSWVFNTITNMVKGWSSAIANASALVIIINLYSHGMIKLGDIILFVAYFGDASSSLWQLAWSLDSYFRNFGTVQNALDGLNGEDERTVPDHVKPPHTDKVSLELVKLGFAYDERPDVAVVNSLDLHIRAGEKIGVVGHSGAGKSTLVGLFLGFYEPTSGEILINGVSATKHDPSYIRSLSSFIPQDTHLFNRSVKENIIYARPDATDAEVTKALKLAQAYKFVMDLPDGIDTIIGERGVKLSGGQRQRIAIARAILQDAPLVIMDEATSALDSVSEQAIQKAFHELMKQRTSIVIAHRLSTLKHLDRIVVMDKGRIQEAGSHNELIKQGGIYADLWERQKDGFIID